MIYMDNEQVKGPSSAVSNHKGKSNNKGIGTENEEKFRRERRLGRCHTYVDQQQEYCACGVSSCEHDLFGS